MRERVKTLPAKVTRFTPELTPLYRSEGMQYNSVQTDHLSGDNHRKGR